MEEEDGVVEEDEWLDPHNLNMFLISSWRIFLLVLSKVPTTTHPLGLLACKLRNFISFE